MRKSVTVDGNARADIRSGQSVTLSADVQAAPGTGNIVAAEWDFDDSGAFAVKEQVTLAPRLTLTRDQTFAKPGTWFPALRVRVQRDDAVGTPFAGVQNLGRVRAVVGD